MAKELMMGDNPMNKQDFTCLPKSMDILDDKNLEKNDLQMDAKSSIDEAMVPRSKDLYGVNTALEDNNGFIQTSSRCNKKKAQANETFVSTEMAIAQETSASDSYWQMEYWKVNLATFDIGEALCKILPYFFKYTLECNIFISTQEMGCALLLSHKIFQIFWKIFTSFSGPNKTKAATNC